MGPSRFRDVAVYMAALSYKTDGVTFGIRWVHDTTFHFHSFTRYGKRKGSGEEWLKLLCGVATACDVTLDLWTMSGPQCENLYHRCGFRHTTIIPPYGPQHATWMIRGPH